MEEFFSLNQASLWITLGISAMIIDLLIFGFSTLVLLFLGIGGIVTGIAMALGVIPENAIAGFACMGITSGIVGALLWSPMKNLQSGDKPKSGHSSDFLGLRFQLDADLTADSNIHYRYSGVDWVLKLAPDSERIAIPKGSTVIVVALSPGIFMVKEA